MGSLVDPPEQSSIVHDAPDPVCDLLEGVGVEEQWSILTPPAGERRTRSPPPAPNPPTPPRRASRRSASRSLTGLRRPHRTRLCLHKGGFHRSRRREKFRVFDVTRFW